MTPVRILRLIIACAVVAPQAAECARQEPAAPPDAHRIEYWKAVQQREVEAKAREAQQYQRLQQSARASVEKMMRQAEQSRIVPSSKAIAPEPEAPWWTGQRDLFVLSFAISLVGVVSIRTLARHRREAEMARARLFELFANVDTSASASTVWVETLPQAASEVVAPADPHAPFFAEAQRAIAQLSNLLKDLNSLSEPSERALVFARMLEQVSAIVEMAKPWPLRPAWQVGGALKLLLERVAAKPKEATVSVIRTIATGLDAWREVCVPGIRPNLITEPRLRILAADDDSLCRMAIDTALRKASLVADFAEDGVQAVEKCSQTPYDMAFLDIQMPEMDGIAACEKIRQTEKNAKTPIVFVTALTDFETRAKTTALGTDFIAKPFLVFEITMKAVICAVRKRLALLPGHATGASAASTKSPISQNEARLSRPSPPQDDPDLKERFYSDAPAYLAGISDLLDDIGSMADPDERNGLVGVLHLRLLTLCAAAKINDLAAATRLSGATESLAKKLLQDPKNIAPSTLHTLSHGLKVLERLCVPGVISDQAMLRPPRLLVVEDEPLARRAVVGALQLAFERPDSANDGAAALEMTTARCYDVIFSDIEMPRMSGLDLCRHIRRSGMNTGTPFVFITGHAEGESRISAVEAGGTDFIAKPFLPIEITVKALALVYERRLPAQQLAAA